MTWRPLLRIARREAARAKGRSALIATMIALPVFALTLVDVLARTAQPDPDEKATWTLGATQYVLRADQPIGSGFLQLPDPTQGSTSRGVAGAPRYADPAELVPPGARVLTEAITSVSVKTRAGRGVVTWQEVMATDPAFRGRFEVLSGRAPRASGEVLATPELLERAGVTVGGTLAVVDPAFEAEVVGTAREAGTLGEETVFARPGTLVGAPGGLAADAAERAFYVANAAPLTWAQVLDLNRKGVSAYDRGIVLDPPPRADVPLYAVAGDAFDRSQEDILFTILAGAVILLLAGLEVVLLAGAAFAVGARRQAHALALLAATGATARQVRRVVLAGGLVLGGVAAVAGVAGGILAAALVRPLVEGIADVPFARFDLRPLELFAAAALALLTGVLAAVVPARAASRQDVVRALAGRPAPPAGGRRVPAAGVALTALGVGAATLGSLWTAAQQDGVSTAGSYAVAGLIAGGASLAVLGLVILSPTIMGAVGRLGARLPLAPRLVVRDAARHRGRSAPAMAAVLAVVSGSAALLLVVAATDDHDRRAYMPMLEERTAAVSLVEYRSAGSRAAEPETVLVDPGPVARAGRAHLPTRSVSVVAQLGGCPAGACGWPSVVAPPENLCPRQPASAEEQAAAARADWRCPDVGSEGMWSHEAYGTGGPVVGDAALLDRLYGIDDPRARAALAAGGAVAFDRTLVDADLRAGDEPPGAIRIDVIVPPEDGTGEERTARSLTVPAVHVRGPRAPAQGVFLSRAAARRTGLPVAPGFVLFDLQRLPTRAEEDATTAALAATGTLNPLDVERGYQSSYGLGLLALVLGAAIVTLGAAGVATGLAQADARADHATLAAVGADPRLRRSLAALQALLIAGLGSALGIAVGFVPAVALIGAIASLELVIPWVPLLSVLVGLPLVAAAGAFACTRARLPLARRLRA